MEEDLKLTDPYGQFAIGVVLLDPRPFLFVLLCSERRRRGLCILDYIGVQGCSKSSCSLNKTTWSIAFNTSKPKALPSTLASSGLWEENLSLGFRWNSCAFFLSVNTKCWHCASHRYRWKAMSNLRADPARRAQLPRSDDRLLRGGDFHGKPVEGK